jgi:hypothetical protein
MKQINPDFRQQVIRADNLLVSANHRRYRFESGSKPARKFLATQTIDPITKKKISNIVELNPALPDPPPASEATSQPDTNGPTPAQIEAHS